MGARVLVTGGTGFVGRRLCAALRAQGFEVWAPGHAELERGWKAAPRVEKVFHLAARTFVPDSWTSFFAFATSGADHVVPGFFVYGQYGL